jgi:hypothetical protein
MGDVRLRRKSARLGKDGGLAQFVMMRFYELLDA